MRTALLTLRPVGVGRHGHDSGPLPVLELRHRIIPGLHGSAFFRGVLESLAFRLDLAVDNLLHLVDIGIEYETVEETGYVPDFGLALHPDRIGVEGHGIGEIRRIVVEEPFAQSLVDLLVDKRHRRFGSVGLDTDGIGLGEDELPGGRIPIIDIELRQRIAGADPPLGHPVRMIGILGVGRQGHDPVGGLFGRTVNPQTALLATIGIHGRTLGLQRILDRVADGHLDPHGLAARVKSPS